MPLICLTAVNSKYSQTNLALLYLKKAINKDTECRLIEWDINRPRRELLEKLVLSGCTHFVFSAYIWNAEYLKALIPDLSILVPKAVICCGGPEAVYNSKIWLKIPGLDLILNGNAEDFASGLEKLTKPGKPAMIDLGSRPFSETAFPYTAESIADLKGRIIYYEASRGCLFNCSYCLSAADCPSSEAGASHSVGSTRSHSDTRSHGSTRSHSPDYRTIEQITEELVILSRFEGTVKFVDRTFNANIGVSRHIWRLMAENPPAGCVHFEIHPMLLQEEDLELVSRLKPGTAQFEIGIQSTDPAVLQNVNRADNWAVSRKAIARLIKTGSFHVHLDQIVGLPGDTPAKAARSLDAIMDLQPDMFQLGFLKLLPGTPLAARSEESGIAAAAIPPYEILQTASFSFGELQRFHRIERLIDILFNSGFFRLTLPVLAENDGGWFNLLNSLSSGKRASNKFSREAPDLSCRRWEYWGQILFDYADLIMSAEVLRITELLRLDWCPFANSQRYPSFIEYNNTKDIDAMKKKACIKIGSEHPELKKSELKRAILYIAESENHAASQEYGSRLFVRTGGIVKQFSV